ncbi:MAG: transcription termination/antitermination protein NusA [candidate division Zixibacteria bacterium]|nr:transcription termination/antitermination protein NusA [candidate division Zixibacteria bacterium]
MMEYDILEALSLIAQEKNLELEYVLETVESALVAAAKKKFGENDTIRAEIDRQSGDIRMYCTKMVVMNVSDPINEVTEKQAEAFYEDVEVGQELDFPIEFADFGRNAITSAKQILIQKVREAEREQIYEEFISKVGNLITGAVQQIDKGNIIVNLGRAEGIILGKEQIKKEKFRQGDRIKAFIIDVQKSNRGPQISLSRSSPDFLRKLFEVEVPEIAEKIIEIKAIAREPGERSKVAVYSNDDRIDAVGACVGVKGSRVQNIVRELNNERIDIVPWSSESMIFVTKSLAPAKIVHVDISHEEAKMLVVVADEKLSLAIGKTGQNARLAAKLTGWKINIMSETEYNALRQTEEMEKVDIEDVEAIKEKMRDKLLSVGIETAQDITLKGVEKLVTIDGVGEKTAEKLVEIAKEAINKKIEDLEKAASEGEVAKPVEFEFTPDDSTAPRLEDY